MIGNNSNFKKEQDSVLLESKKILEDLKQNLALVEKK